MAYVPLEELKVGIFNNYFTTYFLLSTPSTTYVFFSHFSLVKIIDSMKNALLEHEKRVKNLFYVLIRGFFPGGGFFI